jgi:subtilase family serine protease
VKQHQQKISLPSVCLDGWLVRPWRFAVFLMLITALLPEVVPPAYAGDGQYIANSTPGFVSSATNLGSANASTTIEVSIWLQPHNRSALDALAEDLYNPTSPSYRRWLKSSEIASRFAPTAAEAKTVAEFFASNNLKVVSVGPNNFYVRARGTVADVENAFHVQINDYQVGDQTLRANASDPYIEGPAAALVQAVSGFDNVEFEHGLAMRPTRPASNSASIPVLVDIFHAASAADSSGFESVCFPGPKTEEYTTGGGYPKATYKGNVYYDASSGCGYSPSNIYEAYNLNGLYAEGYNGDGQTIVIIDPCGSPTIQTDANTFSKKFGLPKLTASNFNIINYPGPSTCSGVWPIINADVEWTHAIAPGASIDLLVPASKSLEDVDEATYYAVSSGLGNVISGSYYNPEFLVGGNEADKESLISELAAVAGAATNYASGDFSNYTYAFMPPSVSVPADSPYATGVGGVSLALNSDNSIAFQTGWEGHLSILINGWTINDPPSPYNFYGFYGGAGGGPSKFFAKPAFQKGVSGKYRQVPDISWLADPLTGGLIVVSEPGRLPEQVWYATGGTELATPMFSALWAIANQEAGTPLGQAAPYLYSMPSTTITDIVPYASADNVTAVIEDSSSVTHRYNAEGTLVLVPGVPFGKFYSAIGVDPTGVVFAVSFGQDYYLHPKVGWDEVTGLGTPNAKAFADWFAPPVKK